MGFRVKFFAVLCLAACCFFAAFAEDGEIYHIGPDDPFYHSDCECAAVHGNVYLASLEAAEEFRKAPCGVCALELKAQSADISGALVVKIQCTGATPSIDGAVFSREIDGAYYFVLIDHQSEEISMEFKSVGEPYSLRRKLSSDYPDANAVVDITRNSETFVAYDVMGLRLCRYNNFSNHEVLGFEIGIIDRDQGSHASVDEFTGEYAYESEYSLRMPVTWKADMLPGFYWLLTRAEFARMDRVAIIGKDNVFSGDVYFDPFYTGDEEMSSMAGIQPWAVSTDSQFQAKQYNGAGIEKMTALEDYCGYYLNNSGTYTVVIKNPTKKRAREYAKILGDDNWVVQGEYTWNELESARENAQNTIDGNLFSCGVNSMTNRVEVALHGAGVAQFADAALFDPCVNAYYADALIWERGAMASGSENVPYAPISTAEIENSGIVCAMTRSEYPVGAEYISFSVELSEGYCSLELGGGLEKYTDGQWRTVAGNYVYANYSTLSDVFDHKRTQITPGTWSFMIPASEYEPLGAGLYRLKACRTDGDYAVLEFVITDSASPLEPYVQIRPACEKPAPAEHLPRHSAPGYSSKDDDFTAFSAGGWEYRLVCLCDEIWGTSLPAVSTVIAWPKDNPEAVQNVFEIDENVFRMFDTGSGIYINGTNNIYRINYDGSGFETIVSRKMLIKQSLMLGDELYYMTDMHLWRYKDGVSEKIWSPKNCTGDTLEYYDDVLRATSAEGKSVEIDISAK